MTPDPTDLPAEQANLRSLLGSLIAVGGVTPDAAQCLDAELAALFYLTADRPPG